MGDLSLCMYLLKRNFTCISAGDDAKIRVWRVPEGGLKETLTEPELILQGRNQSTLRFELHSNNNSNNHGPNKVE